MARYIFYIEVAGFVALSLVALTIIACFFFQVDDLISSTGDPVPIEAQTTSIQRDTDALITRVFVQNHQSVHRGDPLVEVVENPKWIGRYLVMQRMQTLLDEMESPGQSAELAKQRDEPGQEKNGGASSASGTSTSDSDDAKSSDQSDEPAPLPAIALTPEEQKLRAFLKQRLAEWNSKEVAKSPRVVVRSPVEGVVVAPDDLVFKRVEGGKEILKVADLNDLRLKVKFAGDTVADARIGQQAIIKSISPDYKRGITFRGDTVPQGRHFWQKERVTTSNLLDAKIKKIIKDSFKDQPITQRDDLSFNVKEVKNIEVDADLTTSPIRSSGHHAPAARVPVRSSPKQGDAPADLELTGRVLEGKHNLAVQIGDLPPAVTKQVGKLVTKQLKDQVIDAPQPPGQEGAPVPEDRLRIEGVRNVQVIVKVKGENDQVKGSTKRLKEEAARKALRGYPYDKISDARQFEATVQITNPPQFLKDQVLELMDQGKQVKAKVDVKTGRRPIAFLLLKR